MACPTTEHLQLILPFPEYSSFPDDRTKMLSSKHHIVSVPFFSHFCTLDCLHDTPTSKRLETFLADRLRLGIDRIGVAHDMLMFLVDADVVGLYRHQVCCYVRVQRIEQ